MKLPGGMVSLVLTSQKACNNEPLGLSKKKKHKVQEAKCAAFGHVSLCRMCVRELLLTLTFCTTTRVKFAARIPLCIQNSLCFTEVLGTWLIF